MNMTKHAQARTQQRGIPPLMIDLLEQFGARQKAGDGSVKVFFDKAARRHVKAHVGGLARFVDDYMDVYAVLANDATVITVGHRLEHISRH